jgi:hypothetical protein
MKCFNGFFHRKWAPVVSSCATVWIFKTYRTGKDVFEYVHGKFSIFNKQHSLGTRHSTRQTADNPPRPL